MCAPPIEFERGFIVSRGDVMADACSECGQPHVHTLSGGPGCKAHATGRAHPDRAGLPCRNAPMKGQKVCAMHGGSSRVHREAAQRRIAEEKARKKMQSYGKPVDIGAAEALLDEVKWTYGHVQWLREIVAEIEAKDLTWGRTKEVEGDVVVGNGPSAILEKATTTTDEAKTNAWITLYQSERKHLVDVCKAALSAGIEERRVRLAESQGELVATVIKSIFGDLDLTPDQAAKAPMIAAKHLRLLQGGAA